MLSARPMQLLRSQEDSSPIPIPIPTPRPNQVRPPPPPPSPTHFPQASGDADRPSARPRSRFHRCLSFSSSKTPPRPRSPIPPSPVAASAPKHGPLHDLKRFLNHHIPHPHPSTRSSSATPSSQRSSPSDTTPHTPAEPLLQPQQQRRGLDFDNSSVINAVPALVPGDHPNLKDMDLHHHLFTFISRVLNHKDKPKDKPHSSFLAPETPSPSSTISSKRPSRSPPSTPEPSSTYSHPVPSLSSATHAHLSKKYGKWGRVLGSGAGGTVRLIRGHAKSGGAVYAVKEFRPRRTGESEREYEKKVRAEFCVGACLKHVNVIETVDIVCDRGHYYEVSLRPSFTLHLRLILDRSWNMHHTTSSPSSCPPRCSVQRYFVSFVRYAAVWPISTPWVSPIEISNSITASSPVATLSNSSTLVPRSFLHTPAPTWAALSQVPRASSRIRMAP